MPEEIEDRTIRFKADDTEIKRLEREIESLKREKDKFEQLRSSILKNTADALGGNIPPLQNFTKSKVELEKKFREKESDIRREIAEKRTAEAREMLRKRTADVEESQARAIESLSRERFVTKTGGKPTDVYGLINRSIGEYKRSGAKWTGPSKVTSSSSALELNQALDLLLRAPNIIPERTTRMLTRAKKITSSYFETTSKLKTRQSQESIVSQLSPQTVRILEEVTDPTYSFYGIAERMRGLLAQRVTIQRTKGAESPEDRRIAKAINKMQGIFEKRKIKARVTGMEGLTAEEERVSGEIDKLVAIPKESVSQEVWKQNQKRLENLSLLLGDTRQERQKALEITGMPGTKIEMPTGELSRAGKVYRGRRTRYTQRVTPSLSNLVQSIYGTSQLEEGKDVSIPIEQNIGQSFVADVQKRTHENFLKRNRHLIEMTRRAPREFRGVENLTPEKIAQIISEAPPNRQKVLKPYSVQLSKAVEELLEAGQYYAHSMTKGPQEMLQLFEGYEPLGKEYGSPTSDVGLEEQEKTHRLFDIMEPYAMGKPYGVGVRIIQDRETGKAKLILSKMAARTEKERRGKATEEEDVLAEQISKRALGFGTTEYPLERGEKIYKHGQANVEKYTNKEMFIEGLGKISATPGSEFLYSAGLGLEEGVSPLLQNYQESFATPSFREGTRKELLNKYAQQIFDFINMGATSRGATSTEKIGDIVGKIKKDPSYFYKLTPREKLDAIPSLLEQSKLSPAEFLSRYGQDIIESAHRTMPPHLYSAIEPQLTGFKGIYEKVTGGEESEFTGIAPEIEEMAKSAIRSVSKIPGAEKGRLRYDVERGTFFAPITKPKDYPYVGKGETPEAFKERLSKFYKGTFKEGTMSPFAPSAYTRRSHGVTLRASETGEFVPDMVEITKDAIDKAIESHMQKEYYGPEYRERFQKTRQNIMKEELGKFTGILRKKFGFGEKISPETMTKVREFLATEEGENLRRTTEEEIQKRIFEASETMISESRGKVTSQELLTEEQADLHNMLFGLQKTLGISGLEATKTTSQMIQGRKGILSLNELRNKILGRYMGAQKGMMYRASEVAKDPLFYLMNLLEGKAESREAAFGTKIHKEAEKSLGGLSREGIFPEVELRGRIGGMEAVARTDILRFGQGQDISIGDIKTGQSINPLQMGIFKELLEKGEGLRIAGLPKQAQQELLKRIKSGGRVTSAMFYGMGEESLKEAARIKGGKTSLESPTLQGFFDKATTGIVNNILQGRGTESIEEITGTNIPAAMAGWGQKAAVLQMIAKNAGLLENIQVPIEGQEGKTESLFNLEKFRGTKSLRNKIGMVSKVMKYLEGAGYFNLANIPKGGEERVGGEGTGVAVSGGTLEQSQGVVRGVIAGSEKIAESFDAITGASMSKNAALEAQISVESRYLDHFKKFAEEIQKLGTPIATTMGTIAGAFGTISGGGGGGNRSAATGRRSGGRRTKREEIITPIEAARQSLEQTELFGKEEMVGIRGSYMPQEFKEKREGLIKKLAELREKGTAEWTEKENILLEEINKLDKQKITYRERAKNIMVSGNKAIQGKVEAEEKIADIEQEGQMDVFATATMAEKIGQLEKQGRYFEAERLKQMENEVKATSVIFRSKKGEKITVTPRLAQEITARYTQLTRGGVGGTIYEPKAAQEELAKMYEGPIGELIKIRGNIEKFEGIAKQQPIKMGPPAIPGTKTEVKYGWGRVAAWSSLGDAIQNAFKRIFVWGLATRVVYGATYAIQQRIMEASEVERQMGELQQIMPAENLAPIRTNAMQIGRQYGVAPTQSLQVAGFFARQFRGNIPVINQLTKYTALAANTGGVQPGVVAQGMISAMKEYKLEVSDMPQLIDTWTAIQDKHNLTMEDMIQVTRRAGSAAKELGVSYQELYATAAAVNAITQAGGEQTGALLRYLYGRLHRPEAIKGFENLGISVMRTPTETRPVQTILKELSEKWPQISEGGKESLAKAWGGTRRYQDIFQIMQNFPEYLNAFKDAMNSAGDATHDNEIVMNTLSKRIGVLKSSWQELSISMGDVGILKGLKEIINAMSVVISGAAKLTKPEAGGLIAQPSAWNATMGSATALLPATIMTTMFGGYAKGIGYGKVAEKLSGAAHLLVGAGGLSEREYSSLMTQLANRNVTDEELYKRAMAIPAIIKMTTRPKFGQGLIKYGFKEHPFATTAAGLGLSYALSTGADMIPLNKFGEQQNVARWMRGASWATTGATVGGAATEGNPIGIAIGAAIGGIVGAFKEVKDKADEASSSVRGLGGVITKYKEKIEEMDKAAMTVEGLLKIPLAERTEKYYKNFYEQTQRLTKESPELLRRFQQAGIGPASSPELFKKTYEEAMKTTLPFGKLPFEAMMEKLKKSEEGLFTHRYQEAGTWKSGAIQEGLIPGGLFKEMFEAIAGKKELSKEYLEKISQEGPEFLRNYFNMLGDLAESAKRIPEASNKYLKVIRSPQHKILTQFLLGQSEEILKRTGGAVDIQSLYKEMLQRQMAVGTGRNIPFNEEAFKNIGETGINTTQTWSLIQISDAFRREQDIKNKEILRKQYEGVLGGIKPVELKDYRERMEKELDVLKIGETKVISAWKGGAIGEEGKTYQAIVTRETETGPLRVITNIAGKMQESYANSTNAVNIFTESIPKVVDGLNKLALSAEDATKWNQNMVDRTEKYELSLENLSAQSNRYGGVADDAFLALDKFVKIIMPEREGKKEFDFPEMLSRFNEVGRGVGTWQSKMVGAQPGTPEYLRYAAQIQLGQAVQIYLAREAVKKAEPVGGLEAQVAQTEFEKLRGAYPGAYNILTKGLGETGEETMGVNLRKAFDNFTKMLMQEGQNLQKILGISEQALNSRLQFMQTAGQARIEAGLVTGRISPQQELSEQLKLIGNTIIEKEKMLAEIRGIELAKGVEGIQLIMNKEEELTNLRISGAEKVIKHNKRIVDSLLSGGLSYFESGQEQKKLIRRGMRILFPSTLIEQFRGTQGYSENEIKAGLAAARTVPELPESKAFMRIAGETTLDKLSREVGGLGTFGRGTLTEKYTEAQKNIAGAAKTIESESLGLDKQRNNYLQQIVGLLGGGEKERQMSKIAGGEQGPYINTGPESRRFTMVNAMTGETTYDKELRKPLPPPVGDFYQMGSDYYQKGTDKWLGSIQVEKQRIESENMEKLDKTLSVPEQTTSFIFDDIKNAVKIALEEGANIMLNSIKDGGTNIAKNIKEGISITANDFTDKLSKIKLGIDTNSEFKPIKHSIDTNFNISGNFGIEANSSQISSHINNKLKPVHEKIDNVGNQVTNVVKALDSEIGKSTSRVFIPKQEAGGVV